MSVRKKLKVRREQQAQRERENAERALKEIWKKSKTRGNFEERARGEKAKRKKRGRDERKRTKEERVQRKTRERV